VGTDPTVVQRWIAQVQAERMFAVEAEHLGQDASHVGEDVR
jgi:hypothetical protein